LRPLTNEAGEALEHRVQFDFEIEFSNGGALQAQGFRLDIEGNDISDEALADFVVRDMRLLMVSSVRILNKQILQERHKRWESVTESAWQRKTRRFIDLSHTIEDGLHTYPGLPPARVGDFMTREQSRANYADGTTFHIGSIAMVGNSGTYLDTPFHRFQNGFDLSRLPLERVADLEGITIRVEGMTSNEIGREVFVPWDVRGKAVLIHTNWARFWGQPEYFAGHPFLTEAAANYLAQSGAALVGIDSLNIDSTADARRPVHSALLAASIPIVEHLCRLDALPPNGYRFHAVPVKVAGLGSFPVRAYAQLGQVPGFAK